MYLPEEKLVLDLPYQINPLATNYGCYSQGKTAYSSLMPTYPFSSFIVYTGEALIEEELFKDLLYGLYKTIVE